MPTSFLEHQILPKALVGLSGQWRARGRGTLTWSVFKMYDATLYIGDDQGFPSGRYALALHYLRNLSADQIVAASSMEMARLSSASPADIQAWAAALQAIMPDIKNGDRLLGVFDAQTGVTFFYNDVVCGEIASPAFAEAFGSIWLSEGTRSPALREALLGGQEDHNARVDDRASAAPGKSGR